MEPENEHLPNAGTGKNDPPDTSEEDFTEPGTTSDRLAGDAGVGSVEVERANPASEQPTASEQPIKKKKKKKKEGLGSSRGIETMFRTSYRVHMNLSSIADTKANIMISINGLIISILIASLSSKIDTNTYLLVPTSIMLLGCLVSIVIAVVSARPRVNSELITLDDVRQNKANILFFGHFSNMDEEEFEQGMSELLNNPTMLYQNMIRDIYGLGLVLKTKFKLLRLAYTSFMISLILGILAFISVYVWVVMAQSGSLLD